MEKLQEESEIRIASGNEINARTKLLFQSLLGKFLTENGIERIEAEEKIENPIPMPENERFCATIISTCTSKESGSILLQTAAYPLTMTNRENLKPEMAYVVISIEIPLTAHDKVAAMEEMMGLPVLTPKQRGTEWERLSITNGPAIRRALGMPSNLPPGCD